MTLTKFSAGYSADVRLDLFIAGQRFPLAQIGGGQLVFPAPILLPASSGQVVMSVDGQERKWSVTFQNRPAAARIVQADFHESV